MTWETVNVNQGDFHKNMWNGEWRFQVTVTLFNADTIETFVSENTAWEIWNSVDNTSSFVKVDWENMIIRF